MKKWLLMIQVCVGFGNILHADTPATPHPYVKASEDGRFFFSVVPPLQEGPNWEVKRDPYGVLFEPQDDGSFKELWRLDGFYSFQVYLTYDGRSLVALGPWNTGNIPSSDDLALSIYRDGKLVKQYTVLDLLDDPKSVKASVSHYVWRDEQDEGYPRLTGYGFAIKTVEGTILSFGMDTGELIIRERLETQDRVEAALASKRPEAEAWGLQTLEKLSPVQAELLPLVIDLLGSTDELVREGAVNALPIFGSSAQLALPKLREMSVSSDPDVKLAGEDGLRLLEK